MHSQRKISPNNRSFTGKVFTKRSVCGSVQFESRLERDAIILFDSIPLTKRIQDQPITIPHKTNKGNNGSYTPDFFLDFGTTGPPVLVEVKYREDLFKDWGKLKPKFKAARALCRTKGWNFKILTENEIRTTYLENAKFLKGYRTTSSARFHDSTDYRQEVSRVLSNIDSSTPGELARSLYSCPNRQLDIISTVWSMLSTHQIQADLHQPLTMNSKIWTPDKSAGCEFTQEDYEYVWRL